MAKNAFQQDQIAIRRSARWPMLLAWLCLYLAVWVTYSNHFHNGFHFDDSHTVEGNPYIRDLRFIPKLLTDARTSTQHIQNQIYRPLVSVSLAVDYWLSGGLNPFWFHVSTFLWYLALLPLMYVMFVRVFDDIAPHPRNRYAAFLGVSWYALHPVCAETLNYVYQRGEVFATVGVVGAFVVYGSRPSARKFGLYLVPALVAMFAKQTALVFAPLLFTYQLLFETDWGLARRSQTTGPAKKSQPVWREQWMIAIKRASPAFALCGAFYFFQRGMTPRTWEPGGTSALYYWYTQPIVLLHYFGSFLLPTHLSADTDRGLITSVTNPDFIIGLLFIVAAAAAVWYALRSRETRPLAFGILWFFVASLPTSILPLAEVENDHRMFFPFVGIALAACWGLALMVKRIPSPTAAVRIGLATCAAVLLAAYGYAAHIRNDVWKTEESLWKDVTIKSPHNGRGLMNYGLVLMARADYNGALELFQQALAFTPNYYTLEINLGIAYGGLRQDAEAERHFRRALDLDQKTGSTPFFYARWLNERGRSTEAVEQLQRAIALSPDDLRFSHLLMQIYFDRADVENLHRLAKDTLARFPTDAESLRFSTADPTSRLRAAEQAVKQNPSAAGYLNLSLSYEQSGRHEECISAAREALKLRPDYPEAYNNIAAAYASLGRWDDAIAAAEHAVKLKPGFQLARNNLNYAISQKKKEAAPPNAGK